MLAGQYFANIIYFSCATSAALLRKAYLPRLAPPMATNISYLKSLGVQALSYVLVLLAYLLFSDAGDRIELDRWAILALPLVILHIALLRMGVAFYTSIAIIFIP